MWIALALLSALFAGMTAILSKIGIRDTNATVATAVRTTVILAFLWALALAQGLQAALPAVSARSYLFLTLSGLCTGGSWLCYFEALKLGTVNQVTPVDKSSTILTMLLAFVFLGEPLSLIKIAAMVLLAVGTLLMIERKPATEQQGAQDGRWLLFAVLSAVFAALTSILGKVGIENVPSDLGTALRTTVVLFMAWGMVLISGKTSQVKHISRHDLLFIVLSGVASGLSFLCFYRALQQGPASVVVPLDKLSLVVTILFSRIVLKERMSRRAFGGFVLLIMGTALLLV